MYYWLKESFKSELKDKVDLRFYSVPKKSFHPKSYIIRNDHDSEIYIGSSNISKGALTDSIEWNYRFRKFQNFDDYNTFFNTFEDLFNNHSQIIDDAVMEQYSKDWKRPKVFSQIEPEEETSNISDLFAPKGAHIEALYSLNKTREEGFDKALVVAATGIGKTYLNVLDFIGNYKKAELLPFLLSGKRYSQGQGRKGNLAEEDYPDDCIVDFDFRIIDIFKSIADKQTTIKDKVKEEYFRIKDELGARPSRIEIFRNIDNDVYLGIKNKPAVNPFTNYIEFLKENGELLDNEQNLYNSRGREFINMIETTSMSKSYKMPIFLAFYNDGAVKLTIDEKDVYKSFYNFYNKPSNKVDMLRHKGTADFENWNKVKYLKLAIDNPIKFLLKTHGDFFKTQEGAILALYDDMAGILNDDSFKEHMRDAVELRIEKYYEERNFRE